MRAITKGTEPASLVAHRKTPHSDYDNYAAKDHLRQALVTEQRGLCCYCMGRICSEPACMKIEHWRCQAQYPDKQLTYRNFLGACLGGEGQPAHLQHCDTRKGDRHLEWNPADPERHIEARIRYEPDGSIHADDKNFEKQLNEVLNLNVPALKNHRKSIYDGVLQGWVNQKKKYHGSVPRKRLERKRAEYDAKGPELTPYVQVAVWLLDQNLAKMAA